MNKLLSWQAAKDLRKKWKDKAQGNEKADKHKSNRRIERGEEDRNNQPNQYCSQGRRDDAHVEILQSFYIADDAGKQIAAFEFHQTCWRERFQSFIKP